MFVSVIYCLFASVCYVHAAANPAQIIKLTFGVSKATYLPLENKRYLQNGFIMENRLRGFPPDNDHPACTVGGWTAKHYENQETEVLMFTNSQQKLVVFGFRGTEAANWDDWRKNIAVRLVRVSIGSQTFKIHKGFLQRYNFISSWFENKYNKVPKDYTILLTGHSLGGAEATIAAAYAAGKLKRKPNAVVTYASPKVGNSQFKQYYQRIVGCDRTVRMVSSDDLVPNLPLSLFGFGYIHVCDLLKVTGKSSPSILYAHSMYGAYQDGINRKFKNMNQINIGCDRKHIFSN